MCNRVLSGRSGAPPCLRVITDVRADSILGGGLDIEALRIFHHAFADSQVVTLPHFHAKIYVFDASLALLGSANLTASGLDSNYEYGVGIREPTLVRRIKDDVNAYARIGNVLPWDQVDELYGVAQEIISEYASVQRSAAASARKRFNEKLRAANVKFAEALVGARSANALFSQAILYVLSHGPLPTARMHPQIQSLLPDLCDDSVELVIHGERFGKAWKHQVRNAQQSLKRRGLIDFDGRAWRLLPMSA